MRRRQWRKRKRRSLRKLEAMEHVKAMWGYVNKLINGVFKETKSEEGDFSVKIDRCIILIQYSSSSMYDIIRIIMFP